ncbi:hypothetical protein [Agromyces mediolanus]|uniref:hypothetical protein n=1 Tax=Agromyces mediolanus TaxID=41986 RepID=UPI001E34BA5C|nr:hypothetical protein [Agromyces mediolanus]MCD1571313.1 hypothetical protein [Agromyces mediolanus]
MTISRLAAMVMIAIAASCIIACSAQPDRYRIIDASDSQTTLSWLSDVDPVAEVSDHEVRIDLCGSIAWPLEKDGQIGQPTASHDDCSKSELIARSWIESAEFSSGTWSRDLDMVVLNAQPRLLILGQVAAD